MVYANMPATIVVALILENPVETGKSIYRQMLMCTTSENNYNFLEEKIINKLFKCIAGHNEHVSLLLIYYRQHLWSIKIALLDTVQPYFACLHFNYYLPVYLQWSRFDTSNI